MDVRDRMNEPAVNPGERLKAARERAGWSIEHVALKLRLSPAQVAALEKGEREGLPPAAYVRGYLRSYAQLLGLDPQEFAKARVSADPRPEEARKPVAVPPKTVPWESLAYVLFVLSIVAVVIWWRMDRSAPRRVSQSTVSSVDAIGALPPRLRSLAVPGASDGQLSEFPLKRGPSKRPPLAAVRSSRRLAPGPRKPVRLAAPVPPLARTVPLVRKAPRRASAPPPKTAPKNVRVPPVKVVPRAAVLPAAPASAVPNPGGLISLPQGRPYATLFIRATSTAVRAWVRDANGTRLLATRIAAGHGVHVVGRPPFSVTLNRSRGVVLTVGGHGVALPSTHNGRRVRITVDR